MLKISVRNTATGTCYGAEMTKEDADKWIAQCKDLKAWGEEKDLEITIEDITEQVREKEVERKVCEEGPSLTEMVHALIDGDAEQIEKLRALRKEIKAKYGKQI